MTQSVAQSVTQSWTGQSSLAGEPSAVAASKQLTLPAVASSAQEDIKNADVLIAQNVAATDGAQLMDLDESVTGKKQNPVQTALSCGNLASWPMWPLGCVSSESSQILACLSACVHDVVRCHA